MQSKEQILKKLYSLQRFGIKPGLDRTLALLDFAGNPHLNIKAIHIAGTNGKGSVASAIASVLAEAGYVTGLYTSPHIRDFNERIRVNGIKISDDKLINYAEFLFPCSDKTGSTFFEITTVMAFMYFAETGTDFPVIETGMGGRFDSTNVLTPLVSVITNIALDHQEFLGESVSDIAFEKAGIIKKGVPVVLGHMPEEAEKIISGIAAERNAPLINTKKTGSHEIVEYRDDLSMLIDVSTSQGNYPSVEYPFAGEHQANNILTTLETIGVLKSNYTITQDSIYRGLAAIVKNTGIKARIQLIRTNPEVVIDVSHNPDSITVLLDTLNKCGYDMKWNVVFAAMKDKDYQSSLSILRPITKKIFLCSPDIERAAKAEELGATANNLGYENTVIISDAKSAVRMALEEGERTLILGSFYLVSEIIELFGY